MFDYMWSREKTKGFIAETQFDADIIPLLWSEHCVECAAPVCYDSCQLYRAREDGDCIRIAHAIRPLGRDGKKRVGAKLDYSRWAKIESIYTCRKISEKGAKSLYRCIDMFASFFIRIARMLPGKKKKWIIADGVYSLRFRFMHYFLIKQGMFPKSALLVMKARVVNGNKKIIVEIRDDGEVVFRNTVDLTSKFEEKELVLPVFHDGKFRFLCIYPEDIETTTQIEILFLELVDRQKSPTENNDVHYENAPKVKCVIWDLDNTLWNGILIEDQQVVLKEEILRLIKELDAKGIMNSICSKNDTKHALEKLKEFGILDYFVFPQINWSPKSINIRNIAKAINLAADTFVFVDDSEFEREEVKQAVTGITTIDVADIEEYAKNVRFDVPITEDSKNRRNTYRMLEKQSQELEAWAGNIDDFLRACHMRAIIRKPQESELERCFELLQRTNQLNASGRRLSRSQVEEYVNSPDFNTYVLICNDKYGSYGLVGFSIVKRMSTPLITDFVISCRVANKKVEHAFIQYLAKLSDSNRVRIAYKKTAKNGLIYKVVEDLDMSLCEGTNDFEVYEYLFQRKDDIKDIVTIELG